MSLYGDLGDGQWGNVATSSVRDRGDGRFSIDGAIAGERHVLRAWSLSPAGQTFARVDPWIARPEGNEFTLRLRASGSLECRVVDRAGKPVPFAEVDGGPSRPFPGSGDFLPERTDESGTARLEGLEPTGYRIRAWKGSSLSDPVEVEVPEGDARSVTLVIPR
ncbi:MAG: carboxypeptidase-like regulatory domain-containing protein [Planctomycetota bacterium]